MTRAVLSSSRLLALSSNLVTPIVRIRKEMVGSLGLTSYYVTGNLSKTGAGVLRFLAFYGLSATAGVTAVILPGTMNTAAVIFPFFGASPTEAY